MLASSELLFLNNCYNELLDRTKGLGPSVHRDDFSDDYADDPETIATYLSIESLTLMERGYDATMSKPQTALARMSIRVAAREDAIPPLHGLYPGDLAEGDNESEYDAPLEAIGCFEAEPRFMHSLKKQRMGQKERYPASILLGTDGVPIAYQKGNGQPLAMVSRDGYLPTASGPIWVPKDGIIRPIYKDGYNPRIAYANESLLMLPDPHIESAHLLRFNVASWLPRRIAYGVLRQASNRIEGDRGGGDILSGSLLRGGHVQQKMRAFLNKARVIS